jgi:hypothetical protein
MRLITEDRRRHQRYKIKNFVVVTIEGIYQLIDISKGGFSFKCSPYTSLQETWLTDILNPLEQLLGYPAKRVWIATPEDSSRELLQMLVGVRFGTLTKKQRSLLAQVIQRIPDTQPPELQSDFV